MFALYLIFTNSESGLPINFCIDDIKISDNILRKLVPFKVR